MVANRLPVSRTADGWVVSPGGLVRAVTPVLQGEQGGWVGWAGDPGEAPEPFVQDGVSLVPVEISAEEHALFYEGFSNDTLWPLYHDAIRPSTFDQTWWDAYVAVNRRFAEQRRRAGGRRAAWCGCTTTTCSSSPQHLRELRPDVRIGFFLHIPFPPQELFMRLPWRDEIARRPARRRRGRLPAADGRLQLRRRRPPAGGRRG